MSVSPDKWEKTIVCIGMTEEKNNMQYRTGCRKEFTVSFFDLYRITHWSSAIFSYGDYSILANCKHCHEPNHIPYTKPMYSYQYFSDDDLSSVDKRFIDKLPFKFKRFFSRY